MQKLQKLVSILVRMGKTYQSEQYIVSKLLESKVEFPEIIIFLTEKTVLLDSTYGNIYSK